VARTPEQSNPWPAIGKLVAALVAAGVLVAGFLLPYIGGLGLAANHEAVKFLNTPCNLTETAPPQKSEIYASDGKTLVATIFKQDRQPIPLSQVPKPLQQALIATEDRRFYSHHGVDLRGLLRSAVSTSNGDTQGGSTLTMQYVKQIRYYQASEIQNPKKRIAAENAAIAVNVNRKIEDAKCALYIENTEHESKNTILDNYLNIAFFGENSYGIETAAENYFGKPAKDLTLPESAMLVGLLRAPTAYDPFVYPDAARQRRNQVLQNMVDVGDLSQAQADKYARTPVSLATTAPPPVQEGCANSPSTIVNVGFFCDYVVKWLEDNHVVTPSQLESGGLKIVTTLNPKLQNSMQKKLFKAIPPGSPATSVMPVVDPHTGNVLAMATSKRYGNPTSKKDTSHTTLPLFTSYTANGASTYKLFTMLTALSIGVPTSTQLGQQDGNPTGPYQFVNCLDSTATVENGDANVSYPQNTDMAQATALSSNTYFVGIADQLLDCDLQPIMDLATSLGMKGLTQPSSEKGLNVEQQILKYQNATELVLGDVGTSPLELAGAYAAVANKGRYNAPAPVESITDDTGRVISVPRSAGHQVVAPSVAMEAEQLLEGDTQGDGTSSVPFESWYSQNSSVVAGKTGTAVAADAHGHSSSKDNASVWFVGMTPNLVGVDALENFDQPYAPLAGLPGAPTGSAYGAYASKVWLDALTPYLSKQQWSWPSPADAPGAPVPDLTGKTISDAKTLLKQDGFKFALFDKANQPECASAEPIGSVAYYGPQVAPKGSTITVCPSSGAEPEKYTYVPPPVTHTSTPASGGNSGSGSASGGASSGGASSPAGGGSSSGGAPPAVTNSPTGH